jgi:hypothetical protein
MMLSGWMSLRYIAYQRSSKGQIVNKNLEVWGSRASGRQLGSRASLGDLVSGASWGCRRGPDGGWKSWASDDL